jgi:hypothetical protein
MEFLLEKIVLFFLGIFIKLDIVCALYDKVTGSR